MAVDLQLWFPTVIGVADCPFHKDIKSTYQKHINEFEYDHRGMSYTAIHKDKNFKKLNDWVTEQVNEYTDKHNYPDKYKPVNSWVIDYEQHVGQPWHTHIGCTIATVYYFDSNNKENGTQFRSPYHNDVANPLRLEPYGKNTSTKNYFQGKQNDFNEYTFRSCTYVPVEGRLLIFRSHIEHMVDSKETKDKRIIFSYNFDR